ncbi:hypothetical protein L0U85_13010 [Glycomyces sp. L485]|uniref:hypothetical protein n=1 Tax=Glycomyces sp. L485 TaxID=2909235 RepID=UPI001F4AB404|nr:hypothetical protein [Glycomyces sp. L485]MCH7231764.1 hypothetical protein [Glycomyces sp. L485]
MPSVDALAAAIRAALDQTRHLIAAIAASSESADECRGQLRALSAERSANQLGATVDRLEEGHAQAKAIADRIEATLAMVETARSGSNGGRAMSSPVGTSTSAVTGL